ARSFLPSQKLHKRVSNFGPRVVGDAHGLAFYVFHQAVEVIAGVGDADHSDGGLIPEKARFEFGDGDIEGRAKTVLEAARDLTLVLEGVRGFDAKFEGEESDHEG